VAGKSRLSAGIRDRPVQALSLPGGDARSVVAWTSSSCTRRPYAQGLIAKIPCTRRWRVINCGRNVMGTTMYLREHHFPNVYACAVH
jgi:hypothetical protein